MAERSPDELLSLQRDAAWSALVRADLSAGEVATWDPHLPRDNRLLVPIDVQALYVPEGHDERFVALPFALAGGDGDDPPPMPPPFADGAERPAGVHLHWAAPDALLRGELADVAPGSDNRLALPALADRWVVLRIVAPAGSRRPAIRGWVLEADKARAVPLEQWPDGAADATRAGRTVEPAGLTGAAGGSPSWTAVYDATRDRFAFHDPLDDLDDAAPQGVFGNLATYVVAGWYSDPTLDPLDATHSRDSLFDLLDTLGWTAPEDFEGADELVLDRNVKKAARDHLGLASKARYTASLPGRAEIEHVPASTAFVDRVADAYVVQPWWPRATLLHGEVHGVPVRGRVVADQRPTADRLDVVVGNHDTDLAAALAALALGGEDLAERREVERVLAGFTGQLLSRIGTPDGVIDIEEHEHAAGFASHPGGAGPVERLLPAGEAGPLPAGRTARSLAPKPPKGKPTAGAKSAAGYDSLAKGVLFGPVAADRRELYAPYQLSAFAKASKTILDAERGTIGVAAATAPRIERRPAPRFHAPIEPLIAVRGPKRSLRHHGDGRFSADHKLVCRWPSQVPTAVEGVIDGRALIRSLGNGAVPPEILRLARSALVQDPYLTGWLAAAAAEPRLPEGGQERLHQRLQAEAVLRYGTTGTYDAALTDAARQQGGTRLSALAIAEQLRRFSLVAGVDIDPVGTTAWSQPWVPLWLEWEVDIAVRDRFDGWGLGPIDLEPPDGFDAGERRRIAGRTVLGAGPATTLAASIRGWITEEDQRDTEGAGEADEATEALLDDISAAIDNLDVVAASLDSLHDHLLGLPVGPYGVVSDRTEDGVAPPAPVADPQLLVVGDLRVTRARLVDAFGRTLELPVDGIRVPARAAVDDAPNHLMVRPRLLRPTRWMFRLVDPADLTTASPEATIDQVTPEAMVNPVAGFLLPDHIDEALEIFDTAGHPIGQLMHEPFGGGVTWEIAPGRDGPPDAGPHHGIGASQQVLAALSASLVATDAEVRDGQPAGGAESALTAFLRAIDATLWSVDSFASFGNEHIAGLVGRPVAVVRALLWLEIDDDLDELDLGDEARRAAREQAYAALADRGFPVRLGELTRADDGLLGFYVDDDYTRFHVVDKAVRDGALDTTRFRGHFARYGRTPRVPDPRPIDHPYLEAEDELRVHPGQTVRLTLLMHPMGKVHLTSGIVPRKALQLARDWVNPGLATMSPSVRVGPVLIEPGEVRLPKVSSFPEDQLWTRRATPSTWKHDPIVAATQAAILPVQPAGIEEGYIRVAPRDQAGP